MSANAIRLALNKEFGWENVAVGCIFGAEKALMLPQDKDLCSEREIKNEVCGGYKVIIADPFIETLLPKGSEVKFLSNPHYAVSSKLGGNAVKLIADHFNEWIKERG